MKNKIVQVFLGLACSLSANSSPPNLSIVGLNSDLPYKDNREIISKKEEYFFSSGTFGITSGSQELRVNVSCGDGDEDGVNIYLWANGWGAGKNNSIAKSSEYNSELLITGWNIPPFPYLGTYTIRCEGDDYAASGNESDASEITFTVKPHHPEEISPGEMTYTSKNGSNGVLIGDVNDNLEVECAIYDENRETYELWFMDKDFNAVIKVPPAGTSLENMGSLISSDKPVFNGYIACVGNSSPPGSSPSFNNDLWYVDTQPIIIAQPPVCNEVFKAPVQTHGILKSDTLRLWLTSEVYYTDAVSGAYLNQLPTNRLTHYDEVKGNCFSSQGEKIHCIASGRPGSKIYVVPDFPKPWSGQNIIASNAWYEPAQHKRTTETELGLVQLENATSIHIDRPSGTIGRPTFKIKRIHFKGEGDIINPTTLYLTPGDYFIEDFISDQHTLQKAIVVNDSADPGGIVRLFFKKNVAIEWKMNINTSKPAGQLLIHAPGNITIGHKHNAVDTFAAYANAYAYAGQKMTIGSFGTFRGGFSGKEAEIGPFVDLRQDHNTSFNGFGICDSSPSD